MSNVIPLREQPEWIIDKFRKKIESENSVDWLNAILSEISKIQWNYPEHYEDFLELWNLINEKIMLLVMWWFSDDIYSKF